MTKWIALLSLVLALPAWAFDIPLTTPSRDGLAPMAYGMVSGVVDPLDDTVFHLSAALTPGLQGFLGGGDRFGLVGFWFNTTMRLEPDHITLIPPGIQWIIQLNNPNCPGGCGGGVRQSRFGEFQHKIVWRGPASERPERLDITFGMGQSVVEDDFLMLSTAKPPDSIMIGRFAVYIDGFRLVSGGQEIEGTFVKD
jgi:hypothetical protein